MATDNNDITFHRDRGYASKIRLPLNPCVPLLCILKATNMKELEIKLSEGERRFLLKHINSIVKDFNYGGYTLTYMTRAYSIQAKLKGAKDD